MGANVGDISLQYYSMNSEAAIYSFEPSYETFKILQNRVADLPTIHPIAIALGDKIGTASFYVNKNADTNSLLEPKKMGLSSDSQVSNKKMVTVNVDTIDNFCKDSQIKTIDILKMDIQGGELAALRGATQMLAKKQIRLIYTEAYFRQQYKDQPLFHEISAYLEQFDYYLQDLYNPIYGNGSLAWCDAIFLPVH